MNHSIEVCFSPLLYSKKTTQENFITVVIDVLRATTSICTAFHYGVEKILPVVSLEEAKDLQDQGILVAAERNAIKIDFADFGNSPFEFMNDDLKGKALAYSSTNGTKNIDMAKDADEVVLGSFLNLKSIAGWLTKQEKNIVILCSGWKGRYSTEDTVCAGALAELLLSNKSLITVCDAAKTAIELWKVAKLDLKSFMMDTSAFKRLKRAGLEEILNYTLSLNKLNVIPKMEDGVLVNALQLK